MLTIFLFSGMVLFFSQCTDQPSDSTKDVRGEMYAGSLSCKSCHQTIFTNYQHTNHYRTSNSIKDIPGNLFSTALFAFNDSIKVAVEKRNTGAYQVEYINGREALAKPFDMVFGSGKNAHSFGYWDDKKLFQLPLSYFSSIKGWANSPGFPAHEAFFNRPIISRCFECHGSYIAEDAVQTESITAIRNLDRKSIIYGIDCERCHGPAANHVNFHTLNPDVKVAQYMTSWKSLPQQRKLDVCAVCHSGNDMSTQQSTFSFQPGDTLSNYYFPTFGDAPAKGDVHGKQLQMLAGSRCFQMSKNLECTSCHNAHDNVSDNMAINSISCVKCHQQRDHIDCPLTASLGKAILNNCIDCHMPKEASKAISFQTTDKDELQPYLLRTHRIAIYLEATQKVLTKMKISEKGK